MSALWLIWSHEHNAFWRPNHCGYTRFIERAGRYTREQAEGICRNASYGEGRRYANQPDEDTPPNEIMLPAPEMADELDRAKLSEERAWSERNTAYAKVKAWEAVVFVEQLPMRAVRVDDWGPGEGGETTVPEVTPQKLTDLLDEIAKLRAENERMKGGRG